VSRDILVGAPLDDGDVGARQCQLARQHQPARATAGDYHSMVCHLAPTPYAVCSLRNDRQQANSRIEMRKPILEPNYLVVI
jgi:hypothetical protein